MRSLLTFKSRARAFCVISINCHKREFMSAVGGGIEPQSLIVSKTSNALAPPPKARAKDKRAIHLCTNLRKQLQEDLHPKHCTKRVQYPPLAVDCY